MICILVLFFVCVNGVDQNVTCPYITPREVDLKELDGKWHIAAVATDLEIEGECATILFNHKSNNTTDVSISWIVNDSVSFYNGSVALTVDDSGGDLLLVTYTDQKSETYSILDVNYEHYAVIFACYNNSDGNSSTYELWKLTRMPHLKKMDATKIDQAISNYKLEDTPLLHFNNTEDTCRINSGSLLSPASLILTSAAVITLFRRLY
ncbi:uncharacterized protein LOC123720412 [Pieris brassicae]|uniref:uncharacterized protein LOC123720412 n=1 Tax=Pieris brassicae TaxID=7116 RepID=UPI001E660C13|nr:uncharacterized protein LOC123720412 [Pieris brassicae]